MNVAARLGTGIGMTLRILALAIAFATPIACAQNVPARSGSTVASEQTPTERYEHYRARLAHAGSLDELLPLTSRAVREETAKRPESFRKALLADLQARKLENLRVVEERVEGDHAVLMVEGVTVIDPVHDTRGPARAKVKLVREGGTWCIDEEDWTILGHDSTGITPKDW